MNTEQINLEIKKLKSKKGVSDGWHTFGELYEYRKVYNALLLNEWARQGKYDVHKSKKHNDGEPCFDGEHFIVVAILPTGQISNHYKLKDWNLFHVTVTEKAKYPFDGHTPQDVLQRMYEIV
ncbi:MAG: hypothetical protein M0P69_17560 [Bacteroidales bacterium]|nr:hypothetical protein [Bacteroidales bacterium]